MADYSITKKAGVVSLLTVVSRISGFFRDATISHIFGAGWLTDAFMIAFTIPNMFRRLLAEGALSIAFVPVFSKYSATRSREDYQELLSSTLSLLSLITGVVVLIGIVFSPQIIRLFAPGFENQQFELAVFLNRLMFPYLFFISLTSFFIGVLYSKKSFAVPATSQIELNLVMILCAVLLYRFFNMRIVSLAIGVLTGGFLQLLTQAYYGTKQKYYIPSLRWNPSHPDVKKMMKLMLPATAGIAIYQINLMVSRALASLIEDGTVTYIYLSDRIFELPLGIFAVAIATVSLPALSEYYAKSEIDNFRKTISKSLRSTMFISIPAMFGVLALNLPIISFLFQHGKFTYENTVSCAPIVFNAMLGLFAVSGTRISVQAFYATGDIKSPVWIAFFAFIVNLIFSLMFIYIFHLGGGGLTMANTISNIFNFLILSIVLFKKIGDYEIRRILTTIVKTTIASSVMFLSIFWASGLKVWSTAGNYHIKTLYLFGAIFLGMLIFSITAYLLKIEEMRYSVEALKKRFNKH